ncbi:MAG: hypothetical protein ABEJ73_09820 [Haloplanus sp.]
MRERTRRTVGTVQSALRRRDGRAAFLLAALGYPPLYLASLGHLALGGRGRSIRVVADPLTRAVRQTRPVSFEPVARIVVDPVVLLVSPLDLGVALGLGGLVGVNLAVAVVAWRSPGACGVEQSAGAVAGVPALLTGATCCGPGILFAVGVGVTGASLAALWYATPAAGLLLVASLFVVARGNPSPQD